MASPDLEGEASCSVEWGVQHQVNVKALGDHAEVLGRWGNCSSNKYC